MDAPRITVAAICTAALAFPPVCGATLPGRNGALAVETSQCDTTCYSTLYLVGLDGRRHRPLVDDEQSFGLEPAFDPTGKLIAAAGSSGWVGPGIVLLRADGRGRPRLLTGGVDSSPQWNAGGSRLFFTRAPLLPGTQEPASLTIQSVRRDGSGLRSIASIAGISQCGIDIDVSVRGEIAHDGTCSAGADNSLRGVHVISADGTRSRKVTPDNGGNPSWAPDGRHLAFSASSRSIGPRRLDVYTVRRDGRRLARLAQGYSPAWSPDGRWIAFNRSTPAGRQDLYIVKPTGKGRRRVATGVGRVAAWQPVGG